MGPSFPRGFETDMKLYLLHGFSSSGFPNKYSAGIAHIASCRLMRRHQGRRGLLFFSPRGQATYLQRSKKQNKTKQKQKQQQKKTNHWLWKMAMKMTVSRVPGWLSEASDS